MIIRQHQGRLPWSRSRIVYGLLAFSGGKGGKVGNGALLYIDSIKDRVSGHSGAISAPVSTLGYWIFLLQEVSGSSRK